MATTKADMEFIWNKIPKQKDGKTIRYIPSDIDYLYYYGFVDSRRFTLQEWKKAFVSFKDDKDNYSLTKEQFLTLSKFRLEPDTKAGFDVLTIKEGLWTDAALAKLYTESLVFVSDITEKTFWTYIKALKKAGYHDAKKNLLMTWKIKTGLKKLIEAYPSPTNRLKKEVARIKTERTEKIDHLEKNTDKSDFVLGEKKSEQTLESLNRLQSVEATKAKSESAEPDTESIDIKSLKKPGGKVFG